MKIPGYMKIWHVDLYVAALIALDLLTWSKGTLQWWALLGMFAALLVAAFVNKQEADRVEFRSVEEIDDEEEVEEEEERMISACLDEEEPVIKRELTPEEVEYLRARLVQKVKDEEQQQ